ncbi:MAG: hypothetical protein L0332_07210 [Chloroflexi bacterium]|nr:hypothetical protein [Chloroflexota bacterium]MCI0574747.1 hypothetical protein [Chloroflexota bacterium]MCI0645684.1 hypothetical protein [Chloroflexota bacterium]MCI0726498.1 hypothetical protein [Chloroflexota bacterium]
MILTRRPTRTPEVTGARPPTEATPRPGANTTRQANPEAEETAAPTTPIPELPPRDGALIALQMESRVGVLLDDFPEEMRDRVAEALLERPESYWTGLAYRQARLTRRRLNFRNFVYRDKGSLPLPPEALWAFRLDPAGPERQTIEGHDLVLVGYTFSSTILTDVESPAAAEPALGAVGGRWNEPFILPLDPDLILQRTGNACLNESGFPPNSFDSENAWMFYDHTCQASSGGVGGCHRTRLANESCLEALAAWVGVSETELVFERLAWDEDLAGQVRLGEITQAAAPDIEVVADELANYRITYRYFTAESCALVEQCVAGSGWRRLLQFDATIHNTGVEPLHIGPVRSEDPAHNLFQYNVCHDHFHFSNYGDFLLTGEVESLASKQAFCVESTGRLSNNEYTPLTHPYTCLNQGVQAGWVDEYIAGMDCQWIDITEVDIPAGGADLALDFTFNPDEFLCEGSPVLDEAGNQVWEPSGLETEDGAPIERPQCDFVAGWDANNTASQELFVPPAGSFVTEPCTEGQLGPLRNCGFTEQPAADEDALSCTPGQEVQLSCSVAEDAAPQVLRLCEYSHLLGVGLACTLLDSLANVVVGPEQPVAVTFTCPLPRDVEEEGGRYALYSAPVFDEDQPEPITCVAQQP